MSGTALYRALVHAGAPEEAKEAANALDDNLQSINERLARLDVIVKFNTALLVAILVKSFS